MNYIISNVKVNELYCKVYENRYNETNTFALVQMNERQSVVGLLFSAFFASTRLLQTRSSCICSERYTTFGNWANDTVFTKVGEGTFRRRKIYFIAGKESFPHSNLSGVGKRGLFGFIRPNFLKESNVKETSTAAYVLSRIFSPESNINPITITLLNQFLYKNSAFNSSQLTDLLNYGDKELESIRFTKEQLPPIWKNGKFCFEVCPYCGSSLWSLNNPDIERCIDCGNLIADFREIKIFLKRINSACIITSKTGMRFLEPYYKFARLIGV